jgi:NDP-sugar pyrophosphorylase family protein
MRKLQMRWRMIKPQLIIPMSGLGRRFLQAGFTVPKPLLEVLGRPMIAHVLEMYEGWDDVIFIVNRNHLDNPEFKMEKILMSLRPTGKIVAIDSHSFGPSYAVLKARELIARDKPVVVNYCDFAGEFDLAAYEKELWGTDATLLTYTGFHPHMLRSTNFAYIEKSSTGLVSNIKEKESFTATPMSEEASAGSYGFSSGTRLINAIEKQFQDKLSLNGEFYTSLTLKPVLDDGGQVSSLKMKGFYCWGTPEDVADFDYWTDSIKNIEEKTSTQNKNLPQGMILLAAGRGERVASKVTVPKPAIPVLGKNLWEMAARSCSESFEKVLVIRSETYPFLNVPEDIQLVLLEEITRGQAESARIGLDALNTSDSCPIHILATDNVLPANFSAHIIEFISNMSLDIVVWTARGYPPAELSPEHFSWVRVESSVITAVLYKAAPPKNETGWAIISGNFSFSQSTVATKILDELLSNVESQVNGEYYLDSVITLALKAGIRIGAIEVPNYFSLGTVDELLTFNYWTEVLNTQYNLE